MRIIRKWKDPSCFSVDDNLDYIPNRPGRKYSIIDDHPLRKEAFSSFGYTNLLEEPIFKNFLGINYLPGTAVHFHKDPAPHNYSHVRCNWVISKPVYGGNPIINGKEIEVDVGDLWICYASEETHGSSPMGDGTRIILSFGALILLKEVIEKILDKKVSI
jgi:hypothetical protein